MWDFHVKLLDHSFRRRCRLKKKLTDAPQTGYNTFPLISGSDNSTVKGKMVKNKGFPCFGNKC